MRSFGRLFVNFYRMYRRLESKSFSMLASGAFASFGKNTVLSPPIRIAGEERIALANRVFVGGGSWLQTLPDGHNRSVAISIGSGTSIAGSCVISAVRSIVLEADVLVAANVYISDHMHKYTDTDNSILAQGVDKIQPILIKRGSWLGQNVVVCPGVTIGRGSVIGANSVVTHDIPDNCVAVGVPARVLKAIPRPVSSDVSQAASSQALNRGRAHNPS